MTFIEENELMDMDGGFCIRCTLSICIGSHTSGGSGGSKSGSC